MTWFNLALQQMTDPQREELRERIAMMAGPTNIGENAAFVMTAIGFAFLEIDRLKTRVAQLEAKQARGPLIVTVGGQTWEIDTNNGNAQRTK